MKTSNDPKVKLSITCEGMSNPISLIDMLSKIILLVNKLMFIVFFYHRIINAQLCQLNKGKSKIHMGK